MKVTTDEANTKGLPESFENIRRITIQHGDFNVEVVVDGDGLMIRGISNFGAALSVQPIAMNAVKFYKSGE